MTMTNSERQWLARVMDTISHVTIVEPCNALDRPVQNGAGEDVLPPRKNAIEVLQRGHPKRQLSFTRMPIPAAGKVVSVHSLR